MPEERDDAALCCLSLDLEVRKDGGHIHALAAVRANIGRASKGDIQPLYSFSKENIQPADLKATLNELDGQVEGADVLLGHNLIDFDLPTLRARQPELRLLQILALDTLWLNPLAFPQNPYHKLVKHYKEGSLRRSQRNNPELDAQLTLAVAE